MAEAGVLVCDQISLNERRVAEKLYTSLRLGLENPQRYAKLEVFRTYYFSTQPPLPQVPGWYLLLWGSERIYVGKAQNLNSRLNSESGSRDNFANPKRRVDPARNFIKTFSRTGFFDSLRVCYFTEQEVCSWLDLKAPLSDLDRGNVEKFINLLRCPL